MLHIMNSKSEHLSRASQSYEPTLQKSDDSQVGSSSFEEMLNASTNESATAEIAKEQSTQAETQSSTATSEPKDSESKEVASEGSKVEVQEESKVAKEDSSKSSKDMGKLESALNALPQKAKSDVVSTIKAFKSGKISKEKMTEQISQIVANHTLKSSDSNVNQVAIKDLLGKMESISFAGGKFAVKADSKKQNVVASADTVKKSLESGELDKLFAKADSTGKVDAKSEVQVQDNQIKESSVKSRNHQLDSKVAKKTAVRSGETEVASKEGFDKVDIKDNVATNNSVKADVKFEQLTKGFNEQKADLYEQVSKQTKVLLTQDKVSFSTFVRPEEIGRVDFKFMTKDGKVNGKVILQNQEAADIFRSNVEELRAVFQRSNVELDKLEIQIAGRDINYDGAGMDFASSQGGRSDNASGSGQAGVTAVSRVSEIFEDNMMVEQLITTQDGINIMV